MLIKQIPTRRIPTSLSSRLLRETLRFVPMMSSAI